MLGRERSAGRGGATAPGAQEEPVSAPHVVAHHGPLLDTPAVRTITSADLKDALAKGYADFMANPTHLVVLALIYPVVGLWLASSAFGYDVLPLLFPLASGFALIGPLAGIGLYEMSRRREAGLAPPGPAALAILRSPPRGSLGGGDPGPHDQRHRVPADPRPGRGRRDRDRDLAARRPRQSGHHGALGVRRRSARRAGVAAVLHRARGRHAGARPRHLAPLSQGRGVIRPDRPTAER